MITAEPPPRTSAAEIRFEFDHVGPAATTFECSLDGDAFVACQSPHVYEGLGDGPHEFLVRAVYGGLVDSSPAESSFEVDTEVSGEASTRRTLRVRRSSSVQIPIRVSASEQLDLSADGVVATHCRTYPLRSIVTKVASSSPLTLHVGLRNRGQRRVLRAIERGHKVVGHVAVQLTDELGNLATYEGLVRLRKR